MTKVYWGWVEGTVVEDAGEWRNYLARLPDTAKAEVVDAASEQARDAITPFTVVKHRAIARSSNSCRRRDGCTNCAFRRPAAAIRYWVTNSTAARRRTIHVMSWLSSGLCSRVSTSLPTC